MMSTDFLGKGLRFPFAFQKRSGGAQVSTVTSMDHAHIHESILQILGTRPGERFMNPEFGSRLKDLVFEPNDSVLKGLIRHYVLDAIERWEKRVYVTDVSFDESPDLADDFSNAMTRITSEEAHVRRLNERLLDADVTYMSQPRSHDTT